MTRNGSEEAVALGAMTRDELATLYAWAASEGWNPGLADADIAWESDPAAFVALRHGGALIGGGSIMTLDPRFGFMGLFIMHPEHRGTGLGARLWHHRLARLKARLGPGATIGMDGVFAMAPFYARGGFVTAHRSFRYQGIAQGAFDPAALPLAEIPFALVDAYDRQCGPAARTAFLQRWVHQSAGHALAIVEEGRLAGFGALRPALTGFKFGPVLADSPAIGRRLISSLCARVAGAQVQLDIPEPNPAGLAIARDHGLSESFGCARMYCGPDPGLPLDRIFGLASFEFG